MLHWRTSDSAASGRQGILPCLPIAPENDVACTGKRKQNAISNVIQIPFKFPERSWKTAESIERMIANTGEGLDLPVLSVAVACASDCSDLSPPSGTSSRSGEEDANGN